MDQHQHRSRSSSRSELAHPPASISVAVPHKTPASKLAYSLRAPPSPSASAYPSSSLPSHRHSHLPAHTSTPHCNEANTLLPPHYITPSPLLTPRRTSSHLPSPLITPSPVLPTLATMSPQVLVPPPIPPTPSLQDQLRSASRSERLLRETLRRDRAASLSPRTRVRRPESSSGRIASTSSEMFHSACTDSDEEEDEHHDNALHVSLLFASPTHHQQKIAPPLQRASRSSADVRPSRRTEAHLMEKESIPSVIHINSSHHRQNQPESFIYGAPMTQVRDRCPDRDPTWSSPEVSILFSPTLLLPPLPTHGSFRFHYYFLAVISFFHTGADTFCPTVVIPILSNIFTPSGTNALTFTTILCSCPRNTHYKSSWTCKESHTPEYQLTASTTLPILAHTAPLSRTQTAGNAATYTAIIRCT